MKTKLIDVLEKCIAALRAGSVGYNWHEQCSCNCGIVAQAITGKVHDKMKEGYLNKGLVYLEVNKIRCTWSNLVKEYCPITGESLLEIFNLFYSYGISREDIVHLEYLSDKKILAKSGIDVNEKRYINQTFTIPKQVVIKKQVDIEKVVTVDTEGWFNRFIYGKTKTIIIKEPKIIDAIVTEYEEGKRTVLDTKFEYYKSKENLIKYLSAWVEILKEEDKPVEQKVVQQSSLNFETYTTEKLNVLFENAIAGEKYEVASLYKKELEKRKITINT